MKYISNDWVLEAAVDAAKMALCRGEGTPGAIEAATAIVAAALEAEKALSADA